MVDKKVGRKWPYSQETNGGSWGFCGVIGRVTGSWGIQGVDTGCRGWPCACPVWGNHKGCPYPRNPKEPGYFYLYQFYSLMLEEDVSEKRFTQADWLIK